MSDPFAMCIMDVALGRRYGHSGDDATDCIRMANAAVMARYPNKPWRTYWRPLHLDGRTPPSTENVDTMALVLDGTVVVEPTCSGWYYCQGWRLVDGRWRGHCWLYLAIEGEVGWLVEATSGHSDWCRRVPWGELHRYWGILQCTRVA